MLPVLRSLMVLFLGAEFCGKRVSDKIGTIVGINKKHLGTILWGLYA